MNNLWITGAGPAIRRMRKDIPIGTVAKGMGITTSTLSLIERNQRRLSIADIALFAQLIKVSPQLVLKECLTEALPGFKTGKELVNDILNQLKSILWEN